MTSLFFTLGEGNASDRFTLEVTPEVCVGPADAQSMFGGIGVAAGVAAMEKVTGRPTIWATCQYIAFTHPPRTLDVETTVLAQGHNTTQARTRVLDNGAEVLNVAGSLGSRPGGINRQWIRRPEVPPPADCDPMPIWWQRTGPDVHGQVELRVANGWHLEGEDDGYAALWMRARDPVMIDRPFLAMLGDFMPSALAYAVGRPRLSSLDNTIRFLTTQQTEWVLGDIRLYGAANGFGHGRMAMFAEDGTPLAIASQSLIVRNSSHPAP